MVSAPARRELVRHMVSHGLSERRCLRVVGMSASTYQFSELGAWTLRIHVLNNFVSNVEGWTNKEGIG